MYVAKRRNFGRVRRLNKIMEVITIISKAFFAIALLYVSVLLFYFAFI